MLELISPELIRLNVDDRNEWNVVMSEIEEEELICPFPPSVFELSTVLSSICQYFCGSVRVPLR